MNQQNFEMDRLFDYDVVDSAGERVGTVDNVWADPNSGMPRYLGAKTGMLGGTYVLPVSQAQYDHERRIVQLPFHTEYLKHAPSLSSSADLTAEDERRLETYYGPFVGAPNSQGAMGAMAGGAMNAAQAPINADRSPINAGQGAINTAAARTGEVYGQAKAEARGAVDRTEAAIQGRPMNQPPNASQAGESQVVRESTQSVPGSPVQLRKIVRKERVYVPVEVEREYVVQDSGAGQMQANQPAGASGGFQAPVDGSYPAAGAGNQPVANAEARADQDADRIRQEQARELESRADSAEENANRGSTVRVERPHR